MKIVLAENQMTKKNKVTRNGAMFACFWMHKSFEFIWAKKNLYMKEKSMES